MDNFTDLQIESNNKVEEKEDDQLDPRIPVEFERLNYANEAINHLELQLDDARKSLKEYSQQTEETLIKLEKSIGTAVAKAKSYYDARIKLREVKDSLTKAKHRFERAQALHLAAKELVFVSAENIDEAEKLNQNATTWNETYHQALAKMNDAQREKFQADIDQQYAERVYFDVEKLVLKLEKDLRRSINKSKPYYELKAEYYKELDFHKNKVYGLENCVNEAKTQYQQSLKNLEHISNEIHEQRKQGKLSMNSNKNQTEINQDELPSLQPKSSLPTVSSTVTQKSNNKNESLRSCLLRTGSLPAGVFSTNDDQYLTDDDNDSKNNLNDQFILRSIKAPKPKLVNNKNTEKLESLKNSSLNSTDEYDHQCDSLHTLSDEQVKHLASGYQRSQTGTEDKSFEQSFNVVSESLLY